MHPTSSAPTPSRSSRARGALLGLAAGGASLGELAAILGEELLAPELDLGRAVGRWLGVLDAPHHLPAGHAAALRHLRERGAPPAPGDPLGATTLPVHVVPVALLTDGHPANLLSGTWHVAAITHPSPEVAWAAVALNVAVARLLQGHRDFVGDVTEALRSNDAPAPLLERMRRLPVTRREELAPAEPGAVAAVQAACWLSWHEPIAGRGVEWLAAQGAPAETRAAAAVLYGAHRGEQVAAELAGDVAVDRPRLVALADRLARVVAPR